MRKLEQIAIRLNNDINGNPRYYIGRVELACLFGIETKKLDCWAGDLGLRLYRGSRYGAGYVFQSYNLENELENIKYRLDLARAVRAKMPEYEVRIKGGRIEQKIAGRWKPYSDQALNLANGLSVGLCYEK